MPYTIYEPEDDGELKVPETGIGKGIRNFISSGAKAISDVVSPFSARESLQQQGADSLRKSLNNPNVPQGLKMGGQRILDQQEYRPEGLTIDKSKKAITSILPEKYLEPQSENEEVFQDYASMLPLYFLGGGSKTIGGIAKFFGKTATGRYVGDKLDKVGLGTPGKILGELAVPALFETLNLSNIKKHFEPFKERLYHDLPEIAGNQTIKADNLQKALELSNKSTKGRLHSKEIYENLNHVEDLIKDGTLAVKDLQPLKTKLHTSIYTDKLDALKPVLTAVNHEIENTGKYGKAVKIADQLHKNLLNIDASIEDTSNFIKDTIKTVPIKKASWIKKGANILLDNPVYDTLGTSYKIGKDFPQESAKYALDAFKAAGKKQSGALLSSLNKLGKSLQESEQEPESKYGNSGRYTIYEPQ